MLYQLSYSRIVFRQRRGYPRGEKPIVTAEPQIICLAGGLSRDAPWFCRQVRSHFIREHLPGSGTSRLAFVLGILLIGSMGSGLG